MKKPKAQRSQKLTCYWEDFPLKRDEVLTPISMLEALGVPYHTQLLAELYHFHQGAFFEAKNCTEILRDFFTDIVKQPKALLRYLRYSRSWPFGGYYYHLDQLLLIAKLPKLTINGRVLDVIEAATETLPWRYQKIIDPQHFIFQESDSVVLRLGLDFDSKRPTLLVDEGNAEPDLLASVNLYRSGGSLRFSYHSEYVDFQTAIRLLETAFRMEKKGKNGQ